ncbi:MAG: NAD(P)H-hydrate dehydratase [Candidatus Omnitrophica bacterium]|nr:NAD(P)H-hydrate dehydratase [Candidatus Omnitrophota bacterium]
MLHRKPDSQKGDFGHIFILAGSSRFSGAAVLAGNAAMRSGAGLVTLGIPESLNPAIIKIKFKEVMTLPLPETKPGVLALGAYSRIKDFLKEADVLVIGPGLGRQASTQKLIRKIITEVNIPVVIDADGLNALVGQLNILRTKHCVPGNVILTPHPGEMARLLGISVAKVQQARKGIAQKFSRDYKVTLVLKGNHTVVSSSGNLYINNTGNPGMATAGSGDCLAGMIAAFLGQGLEAFNAAKFAVYLHGMAGDLAAKEKTQISLIASDIIDKIPQAIKHGCK